MQVVMRITLSKQDLQHLLNDYEATIELSLAPNMLIEISKGD